MNKMICFDMDGTIADLYQVDGWLEYIQAEDPFPYYEAKPMWDMEKLNNVLIRLQNHGWEIRVISWLAKDSSEAYKDKVRLAKLCWLKAYNFPLDKVHLVAYGTTKADCIRRAKTDYAVLVDDNKAIRSGWHMGKTINPEDGNLIEQLEALLQKGSN